MPKLGLWNLKIKLGLKNLLNSVANKTQPTELRERVWAQKLYDHEDRTCHTWLPDPAVREPPDKPLCVHSFHLYGSMWRWY